MASEYRIKYGPLIKWWYEYWPKSLVFRCQIKSIRQAVLLCSVFQSLRNLNVRYSDTYCTGHLNNVQDIIGHLPGKHRDSRVSINLIVKVVTWLRWRSDWCRVWTRCTLLNWGGGSKSFDPSSRASRWRRKWAATSSESFSGAKSNRFRASAIISVTDFVNNWKQKRIF